MWSVVRTECLSIKAKMEVHKNVLLSSLFYEMRVRCGKKSTLKWFNNIQGMHEI